MYIGKNIHNYTCICIFVLGIPFFGHNKNMSEVVVFRWVKEDYADISHYYLILKLMGPLTRGGGGGFPSRSRWLRISGFKLRFNTSFISLPWMKLQWKNCFLRGGGKVYLGSFDPGTAWLLFRDFTIIRSLYYLRVSDRWYPPFLFFFPNRTTLRDQYSIAL